MVWFESELSVCFHAQQVVELRFIRLVAEAGRTSESYCHTTIISELKYFPFVGVNMGLLLNGNRFQKHTAYILYDW